MKDKVRSQYTLGGFIVIISRLPVIGVVSTMYSQSNSLSLKRNSSFLHNFDLAYTLMLTYPTSFPYQRNKNDKRLVVPYKPVPSFFTRWFFLLVFHRRWRGRRGPDRSRALRSRRCVRSEGGWLSRSTFLLNTHVR